jgi:hypothetical protein
MFNLFSENKNACQLLRYAPHFSLYLVVSKALAFVVCKYQSGTGKQPYCIARNNFSCISPKIQHREESSKFKVRDIFHVTYKFY